MDRSGSPLSSYERRVLTEIETALRADEDLDRSLSTMHPARQHRLAQALGRVPLFAVLLLCATSLALAAVAAEVWRPQVLFFFALVWAGTLAVLTARVVRHFAGRLREGHHRRDKGRATQAG